MTTERKTKAARREEVLDAARVIFASLGYNGASTEVIAAAAGISQPYVFRLFGTKKELYKAVVARSFRDTLAVFQLAGEGLGGQEALDAITRVYLEVLLPDRVFLKSQMQAYSASEDPEICAVVRTGFGELVAYAERVSGLPPERLSLLFAKGMLLNVFASLGLGPDAEEAWARGILQGCMELR